MMMYQLPIDMMARIASVILATMSPPFHNASRPYGLSTTSIARVGAAWAATGAGAGAVAAGSAAAAGAAVGACAAAICGRTAEAAAMSRTAAETAKRVIFNILSPGEWLLVIQSENGFGVRHHRIAIPAGNPPVCRMRAQRCRCLFRAHQIGAVDTHWQMHIGTLEHAIGPRHG